MDDMKSVLFSTAICYNELALKHVNKSPKDFEMYVYMAYGIEIVISKLNLFDEYLETWRKNEPDSKSKIHYDCESG